MDRASQSEQPLFERIRDAARHHDQAVIGILAAAAGKDDKALTPDQVHEVRVAIKNLRALWRLLAVRGGSDPLERSRALRDAAAGLAESRDNQVMQETLETLAAAAKREYEKEALAVVRERFTEQAPGTTHPQPSGDLDAVFRQDLEAWHALTLKGGDRALIRDGLTQVYKRTRRRGLEAVAAGEVETWHRFRKWAKYLLYQLTPLASADDTLSLKDLNKLGKNLGLLHDLHMLDEYLRVLGKAKDGGDRESLANVRQLIARREAALTEDCEKRTRRFFELKPKAFRNQLEKTLTRV